MKAYHYARKTCEKLSTKRSGPFLERLDLLYSPCEAIAWGAIV